MKDIEFKNIAARGGSQSNAFEELTSQLARLACPTGASFDRFRGAGGDGGVECLSREPGGLVKGWQAKFVFDIDQLIIHLDASLNTALAIHKDLAEYIVCFPFDPTGKTARKTKKGLPAKSQSEKLNDWIRTATQKAEGSGRNLKITPWPAGKIQSLLLKHDVSGGIRYYFFSETILSPDWFKDHLAAAAKTAGPRYTTSFNVETDLWAWFSAFEAGDKWRESFEKNLAQYREALRSLKRQITDQRGDPMNPAWPANELRSGKEALKKFENVLTVAKSAQAQPSEDRLDDLLKAITGAGEILGRLEIPLADEIDSRHGKGRANSESFRRWMAENQCSFPAANLDSVRDGIKALDALSAWLHSPNGFLAFKGVFILSGAGGSGKTHGVCDMALKRFDSQRYTCILFGHQFSGLPNEWTRLAESLGLPLMIGKDGVLDALNAVAEASGQILIFCIDAVNETRPRDYWLNRFQPLAHEFEKRSHLKLCLSCRTSFLSACLPPPHPYSIVEHQGFAGIEREACNSFFQHYELDPPLIPVLQPELANPLYLKLVCEALKLRGLKRLPNGWHGLTPVIRAFLSEKEKQFANEHGTSPGADIVGGSLLAIASAIADSGEAAIPWSEAQVAATKKRPQAAALPVLEWLVKADLLIEDGPSTTGVLGGENVLRPAFERFGDFLVASELLSKVAPQNFAASFTSNTNIQRILGSKTSVEANAGTVQALSILVPEIASLELVDLVTDVGAKEGALKLSIRAVPWRTSETFTDSTRILVKKSLTKDEEAIDSLLAVCTQVSKIDAIWTSELIASVPIPKRDAFWSSYLHNTFEKNRIAKRLIDATSDIDLSKLDTDTALRWSLILLWFTAAADRRVKDHATRSAVAIARSKPEIIPELVERLMTSDDDKVRERVLLCAYGALIASRNLKALKSTAEKLLSDYQSAPIAFQNAIIRDHIRCIAELARHLGCLDPKFDPETSSKKHKSDWPLEFPTEEEVKKWGGGRDALYRVQHSALHDDFNHYSINCLHAWTKTINKQAIGGWILKHIVEDFGFDEGHCDDYDQQIAYVQGGGRSKPAWAERIGKKYQWISMYQLASRLHDNVTPELSSWDPEPLRNPLILMDERKLDPTLSKTIFPEKNPSKCWWLRSGVDLSATKNMDFVSWIAKQDDLPTLETLLQPTIKNQQRWIVLTGFPTWSEYRSDAGYGTPYRWTWIHIRSYLVLKTDLAKAIKTLEGRNYFNGWMPEGAKWLHAFAGEYPWATSCNTEPDWYLGAGEEVDGCSLKLTHSANEIVSEWEYDPTLPKSIYLQVPTKMLLSAGDLWWNGTDGFGVPNGKTVFCDPNVRDGGAPALLADLDDLLPRIDKLGYRLIWTMLGEKAILADEVNKTAPIVYSQLAILNEDGSVTAKKRSFFKLGENEGPRKI